MGCRHMGLLFSYLFHIQWKIMVILEKAEADCAFSSVGSAKLEKPTLSFQGVGKSRDSQSWLLW